jgi:hypothetical protein
VKDGESFPEASKGRARDAIARHISEVPGQKMSGRTYEKAKAVVEAARPPAWINPPTGSVDATCGSFRPRLFGQAGRADLGV